MSSAVRPADPAPRPALARGLRHRLAIRPAAGEWWLTGLVVAGQAVWFAVLCSRGWFLNDDFSFIRDAVGRAPTWSYLTMPVNVHLAPGLRLSFWVLQHTVGLSWWPTVVARVVLQAACTAALYLLLRRLAVPARLALGCLIVYAFSPLLIPATLYLASAVNQVPSQLAVVAALHCLVSYCRSRRLRWALACGLSLLVAACFWEKAAVEGAMLVIALRFGWLSSGSWRSRLRQLAVDVRGWGLMFGPLAAYFGYFVARGFGAGPRTKLGLGTDLHLIWTQWSHALWPTAVGGPWRWYSLRDVYDSAANPRLGAVVAGQVLVVVLLVVSWRRRRWGGVAAWLVLLGITGVGEVLVASGRFAVLGNLTSLDLHYAADLGVPAAVLVALALSPRSPAVPTAPAIDEPPRRRPPLRRLGLAVVSGLTAVAFVISAGISSTAWADRWHDSQAHRYVTQLIASVRRAPPPVNLFDVGPPVQVITYLEPHRHVSDLLADADVPAEYGRAVSMPKTVDASGHVIPAGENTFAQAGLSPTASKLCPRLVRGSGTFTFRFTTPLPTAEYFLKVSFFQARPTGLDVSVRDRAGHAIGIRDSHLVGRDNTLGTDYVALDYGSPASVVFVSNSDATDICLTDVALVQPTAQSR